jgi:hypothetical protein
MSSLNFYYEALHNFVNFHLDDFNQSKQYDSDKAVPELTYIPVGEAKKDPAYLGNKTYYKDFIDLIIDNLFYASEPVFDLKGHYDNYDGKTLNSVEYKDDYIFNRAGLSRYLSTKVAIDSYKVYLSIKNNTILDKRSLFLFAFGSNLIELMSTQKCPKCSKYVSFYLNFKENKIQMIDDDSEACTYKDKKPTNVKVTITAPSKKLVFLNNPRKFFNKQREDRYEYSINSTAGCIKETEFYAAHNIGFFFVGNTMLDAFKKDKEILISNYDEEDEESSHFKKLMSYENVGSVCMDLWWYTLLDYDLYNTLCEANKVNPDDIEHVVIAIDGTTVDINHSLKAHSKGHYWGIHSKLKVKK